MPPSFQPYFEFWLKVFCPGCSKINWLYNSHSERFYGDDVDGCKCWSCGHKFWLGDKDSYKEFNYAELEDEELTAEQVWEAVYFVEGRDSPE